MGERGLRVLLVAGGVADLALGLAQALVPNLLARIAAGSIAARSLTEQRGASNARARAEVGFQPRFRSWREDFRTGLA